MTCPSPDHIQPDEKQDMDGSPKVQEQLKRIEEKQSKLQSDLDYMCNRLDKLCTQLPVERNGEERHPTHISAVVQRIGLRLLQKIVVDKSEIVIGNHSLLRNIIGNINLEHILNMYDGGSKR